MNECEEWLEETLAVFPTIKKKKVKAAYKKMSQKGLGYVKAKIPRIIDMDAEALLLGNQMSIKERRLKPKEYNIFINEKFIKIQNIALRKEMIQNVLIHELLHIENDDLITKSKDYSRRAKKKIHVNEFEEEVFNRYNKLREIKGIMQIQKKEHLDTAIRKILESINWWQ